MKTNKPEVKRYTPAYGVDSVMRGHLFMDECDHGAWVSLEDYEALQAECEKLRKDAERYRWLRDNCEMTADEYGTAGQLYFGTYQAGRLDEAIDAAIDAATQADNPC